jgi:hypothetical protein
MPRKTSGLAASTGTIQSHPITPFLSKAENYQNFFLRLLVQSRPTSTETGDPGSGRRLVSV